MLIVKIMSISKKSLYALLLSDEYNNIAQKLENHRIDIADIVKNGITYELRGEYYYPIFQASRK